MHGESVQHALRSVFGPDASRRSQPVLAAVSGATDFLAEAYYPEPLGWGARVLAVDGGTGVRVAAALFQHGRCVGLHETVVAGWADGRPVGLARTPLRRCAPRVCPVPTRSTRCTALPIGLRTGRRRITSPRARRLRCASATATRAGAASDAVLARAAEQMRVEFLGRVFAARPRRTGG